MKLNRDLAYKHLDEAEKVLADLKFKLMFSLYPVNSRNLEKFDRLKLLIDNAEKILSEDATEGGDKDAK